MFFLFLVVLASFLLLLNQYVKAHDWQSINTWLSDWAREKPNVQKRVVRDIEAPLVVPLLNIASAVLKEDKLKDECVCNNYN